MPLFNVFSRMVKALSEAMDSNVSSEWKGEPTVEDVLQAQSILLACGLPQELIDSIIDMAEYWPHTTSFPSEPHTICADENRLIVSMS